MRALLIPHGLIRTEVDRGIGSLPPGTPPPYHAVAHLFFRTLADLDAAVEATAAELMADEQNYTDIQGVIQIGEVVD